jgi:hypothetical protein
MRDDSGDGMGGPVTPRAAPLLGGSLGPAHLRRELMRSSIHGSGRAEIGEGAVVNHRSTSGWCLGWMRGTVEGSYSHSHEGKVGLQRGVSARCCS